MAGPGEKTSGWDGGGWPKGDVAQLLNKLRRDRALLARMGIPDEGPSLLEQYFSNEISLPDPPASPTLLTVTCRLAGAKPPIWRRLELRGDLTLDMLHDCLQAAMGWTDSHLHHFELPMERRRARPRFFLTEFDLEEGEDGTSESEVRLDQVLRKEGDTLKYVYDFGDDWEHTLKVEKTRVATDEDPPARCIKAVRACPPEDVGGIWRWNELAAALRANPDPQALTGDLEDYANWLADGIDPDDVDLDDIHADLEIASADPDELLEALGHTLQMIVTGPDTLRALLMRVDAATRDELIELHQSIEAAEPSEEDLREVLLPWVVLLDLAGAEGIPLTKSGWMSPTACETLWKDGGLDWGFGKGNREQHTPEIHRVREFAREAGLIRKNRDRLLLTKKGKAAAVDIQQLARAVGEGLLKAKETSTEDERVLLMLLLASGWQGPELPETGPGGYDAKDQLLDEVARLMDRAGWSMGTRPIVRMDLSDAREVLRILTLHKAAQPGPTGLPEPAARYIAALALTSES